MKITIITVCYNSESTIIKTIESVRSQSYSNIEYIVVDGVSNDETLDILEKNRDIIDILISEPDKGLYDAMNKGIKASSGDIIGIINSDDTFYNHQILERIAEFHNQNDVDVSIGNVVQHNQEGKIKRLYSSKMWSPEKLKIGFMPPHPSIFFKRELFEKYGFYQLDFKSGADYELLTRFFLKHQITWAYSGITTTKMLMGGISSSGYSSYKLITSEIVRALKRNDVSFSSFKIKNRWVWKLMGFIKK